MKQKNFQLKELFVNIRNRLLLCSFLIFNFSFAFAQQATITDITGTVELMQAGSTAWKNAVKALRSIRLFPPASKAPPSSASETPSSPSDPSPAFPLPIKKADSEAAGQQTECFS